MRTVSKHLGIDLGWAAPSCDPTTLARHDGRMLLTSGWVGHLLRATVARAMSDASVRALVGRAQQVYAERRQTLIASLGQYGITAYGESGLNVWVPVRDESAVVNGLRSRGWWIAAGARFRIAMPPAVRITTAGLEPPDAGRPASDFAGVLGESGATYGG